jgi:hypothetical protein
VKVYIQDRKYKAAGPMEGWINGDTRFPGTTAPWTQAYLAIVLAWTNDMGYPDAGHLVGWMSNFLTGLFTSGDQGFEPMRGAAYNLRVAEEGSGKPLSNWGEAFKQSKLEDLTRQAEIETWQDYGRINQAALAGVLSIAPTPRAQKAYDFVRARVDKIDYRQSRGDPTFAIVPRSASAAQ